MAATTIKAARQALRDQILAMSGTAYGGTWKETVFPLGILDEPANRGHLAFSIVDEATENTAHRGKSGETIAHTLRLRVSFLYQLTPAAADLMDGWDLSSDALQDVIQALYDQGAWTDDLYVRFERSNRTRLSDTAWLQIDAFFSVEHELTV